MNAISSYEKQYKESATDIICGEIFRHENGVITYGCCMCQLKFSSGFDFESHVIDHFLVVRDDQAATSDNGHGAEEAIRVENLSVKQEDDSYDADCIVEMIEIDDDDETEEKHPTVDRVLNAPTDNGHDWTVTCTCCDEKFACQGLRDQHIFKKTVAYSKCSLCPAYFSDRLSRMHHKVLHYLPAAKQIKCPHCGRLFEMEEAMAEHIFKNAPPLNLTNAVQPLQHLPKISSPPKPIYECDICGSTTTSKVRLENHLLNHVAFKYDCANCGRHFKNMDQLRRHMFSHSQMKLFECNLCDKSYVHSGSLREHKRTHNGRRDYICHLCGKTYKNSHTFNKHIKEFHERVKTFVCTDCGDAFYTVHLLGDHMRAQHTLERPYVCRACRKSFTSAKLLAAHARSHSGEQYQCRHCDRLFNHPTNRWVHEKRKHLHFID